MLTEDIGRDDMIVIPSILYFRIRICQKNCQSIIGAMPGLWQNVDLFRFAVLK